MTTIVHQFDTDNGPCIVFRTGADYPFVLNNKCTCAGHVILRRTENISSDLLGIHSVPLHVSMASTLGRQIRSETWRCHEVRTYIRLKSNFVNDAIVCVDWHPESGLSITVFGSDDMGPWFTCGACHPVTRLKSFSVDELNGVACWQHTDGDSGFEQFDWGFNYARGTALWQLPGGRDVLIERASRQVRN